MGSGGRDCGGERTGNLWRAQGRRARLELKHFARHVMNEVILHPDEVQGWRGEIHDGDVAKPEESTSDDTEDSPDGGRRHDSRQASSRPARKRPQPDEQPRRRTADERPPARQARER